MIKKKIGRQFYFLFYYFPYIYKEYFRYKNSFSLHLKILWEKSNNNLLKIPTIIITCNLNFMNFN